jgi:hypothetical protein
VFASTVADDRLLHAALQRAWRERGTAVEVVDMGAASRGRPMLAAEDRLHRSLPPVLARHAASDGGGDAGGSADEGAERDWHACWTPGPSQTVRHTLAVRDAVQVSTCTHCPFDGSANAVGVSAADASKAAVYVAMRVGTTHVWGAASWGAWATLR